MSWLRNITPKGYGKVVDTDTYLTSDTKINVRGQVSKVDFLPKNLLNSSTEQVLQTSFSNGFSGGFR